MYKYVTDYFYNALSKNKRLTVKLSAYAPINESEDKVVCIYVTSLNAYEQDLLSNSPCSWNINYKIDFYAKSEENELTQLSCDMFTMGKQALKDTPAPDNISYEITNIDNTFDIGNPSSVCVSFTIAVTTIF